MFTKNHFVGAVFLIIGTLLAACSGSTSRQITDKGAGGTARGLDVVAVGAPFSFQVVEGLSIKEEVVEEVNPLPEVLVLGQFNPAANEIEDAMVAVQADWDQLESSTSDGETVEASGAVEADASLRQSDLPVMEVEAAMAELQAAENLLAHYAEIRQQVETETFNGEFGNVERPVMVDGELWTLTDAEDAYIAAHEARDQAELLLDTAKIAQQESQFEALLVGTYALTPINIEEAQIEALSAEEALAHFRDIRSLVEAEIFNGDFGDVERAVIIDGERWTLEEARSAYIDALDSYNNALQQLESAQNQ